MNIIRWEPIDTEEVDFVEFDFTLYARGVAIANVLGVTATAERGDDATPQALLEGVPQISGWIVVQRVRGRVDGAVYKLRCKVEFADGRVHVLAGLLPVEIK